MLAVYGVVAALQPIPEFGRIYAAYGGVSIALALLWGVVVDGFRPDRYDLLGAAICLAGAAVIVFPRGGAQEGAWDGGAALPRSPISRSSG